MMKTDRAIKKMATGVTVALVVIAVIICLAYLSQKEFRETMVFQTQQQLLTLANTIGRGVQDFMKTHSDGLMTAAKDGLLQGKGGESRKVAARYVLLVAFYEAHKKEIENVRLFDQGGRLIAQYPAEDGVEGSVGENFSDRPEIAYVLRKRLPHSVEIFPGESKDLVITISEPILDKDAFLGVIQRTVRLDTVSRRFVSPVKLHGRGYAWMFDGNDMIVSHPEKKFIGVSVMDLIIDMHLERGETFNEQQLLEHIQKDHGYIRSAKVQNEGMGVFVACTTHQDELVAYRNVSVGDVHWYLVATLPYKEIAGPITKHARNIFGLASIVLLLFAVGGALFFKTQKRRAELEAESKYLKEIALSAEALKESERRLRDLVENSLTGIFIVRDDHIVYKNPEQERLFGPLPEPFDLSEFRNIHPDDKENFERFYKTALSGEAQALDTEIRFYPMDKVGSTVDMRWVHCRASLIQFQGENALLVNMMDMTRAKELERLVLMKQKMVSLGHVAAGMAHEIRNPLSGINIYLTNLKRVMERYQGIEPEGLGKSTEIIGQLRSASEKIEAVIKRVMDFSKPSQPKLALVDINTSVQEAINLSSVTLRKSGIELDTSLDPNVPLCYADYHMIEQVILNLVTNAAQAMRKVEGLKKIRIATFGENTHVVVIVSDSGPGVPQDLKDKIFEPFFTTKSDSSGIGLSISHRIVSDHDGFLSVGTSQWGGAEFTIKIPVKKERRSYG